MKNHNSSVGFVIRKRLFSRYLLIGVFKPKTDPTRIPQRDIGDGPALCFALLVAGAFVILKHYNLIS